jgi:cyclic beta-1,2-glucan synthetase
MAHHQGMTIVAIADALLDGAMRARFHAEPIVRRPNCCCRSARRATSRRFVRPWPEEGRSPPHRRDVGSAGGGAFVRAQATPATQLLSNGRYAVMLTAAGSGYSRWRDWR